MNLKSIFEYDDFREFLRDWFSETKKTDPKFSFRVFAKKAGLKTPNLLLLAMKNKRNLAESTIPRFAQAMDLNIGEAQYFENLVKFNQAKTINDQQIFAQRVFKSKGYRKAHPLAEPLFNYHSSWYYAVIRELVVTESFDENPEWISKALHSKVSPTQARQAIDELCRLGFLGRDEYGKLRPTEEAVVSPDQVTRAFFARFHKEMILRASESIDEVPQELREISSLTFNISKSNIQQIRKVILDLKKELVEILVKEKSGDSVYQLNFQLFPVADSQRGEK